MLNSIKILNKYGVRVSVLETLLTHVQDFKETDYVKHSEEYGTSHAFRVLFYVLAHNSFKKSMGSALANVLIVAAKYHTLGLNPDSPDSNYGALSYNRMLELGSGVRGCSVYVIPEYEPIIKEILRYIVENHCKSENEAYDNVELYPLLHAQKWVALELMRIFRDSLMLAKGKSTDDLVAILQVPYSQRLAHISAHVYTTLLP